MKKLVAATVLTLSAVLPFLISPTRGPENERPDGYSRVVVITGPLHIVLNCDSPEFILLARDPAMVLEPDRKNWQSRPGYVVIGWSIACVIRALPLDKVGMWSSGRDGAGSPAVGSPALIGMHEPGPLWGKPVGNLPEYLGYIVLNFALLVSSILLTTKLLGIKNLYKPAILFPLAILACNELTKAFFWTPHLQIFNVFYPILSIALNAWILSYKGTIGPYQISLIGIALGLGALVYGAFLVSMAAAALCLLVGQDPPPLRGLLRRDINRVLLLVAAFAAPIATWVAFVRARTGSFYAYETERYRHFVWLVDAWNMGGRTFVTKLTSNLQAFVETIPPVVALPSLALAFVAIASSALGQSRKPSDRDRVLCKSVLAFFAVGIPFYALMGLYRSRLTWVFVPPLLIVLALELEKFVDGLSPSRRLPVNVALLGLTLAHVFYWVFTVGPFS